MNLATVFFTALCKVHYRILTLMLLGACFVDSGSGGPGEPGRRTQVGSGSGLWKINQYLLLTRSRSSASGRKQKNQTSLRDILSD